jgi:hypothetical protein
VRAEAIARREIRAIEDGFALIGIDLVESSWPLVQWRFDRLGLLGPAARPIVPRLEKFRDHPNLFIRSWARDALERIAAAK